MNLYRKTKKRKKGKKGKGTDTFHIKLEERSPVTRRQKELEKAKKKLEKVELKKHNKTNKKGFFNKVRQAFTRKKKFSPIELNMQLKYRPNYKENTNSSDKKYKEFASLHKKLENGEINRNEFLQKMNVLVNNQK